MKKTRLYSREINEISALKLRPSVVERSDWPSADCWLTRLRAQCFCSTFPEAPFCWKHCSHVGPNTESVSTRTASQTKHRLWTGTDQASLPVGLFTGGHTHCDVTSGCFQLHSLVSSAVHVSFQSVFTQSHLCVLALSPSRCRLKRW